MKSFYSHGKLLLTGEYAVLDGALSLAVPTRYGQSLSVTEIDSSGAMESPRLVWHSLDHTGSVWFRTILGLKRLHRDATPVPDVSVEETLLKILREARKLNPDFLSEAMGNSTDGIGNARDGIENSRDGIGDEKYMQGYEVTTQLDFPRNWGLGSSSTLINNIAQWAGVDAYELLWNAFSGSGYDIACAQHDCPILYRLREEISDSKEYRATQEIKKQQEEEEYLEEGFRKRQAGKKYHREKRQVGKRHTSGKSLIPRRNPQVKETDFDPPFRDQLYFVHLNQKQNSREGIARYRQQDFDRPGLVKRISEITRKTVLCKNLTEFESLMTEHEILISGVLQMPTIAESLFPDYPGVVKSLGAWGGDFVMATGNAETSSYFMEKGYETVIPYSKMVLELKG